MINDGIYEQIINTKLQNELDNLEAYGDMALVAEQTERSEWWLGKIANKQSHRQQGIDVILADILKNRWTVAKIANWISISLCCIKGSEKERASDGLH